MYLGYLKQMFCRLFLELFTYLLCYVKKLLNSDIYCIEWSVRFIVTVNNK